MEGELLDLLSPAWRIMLLSDGSVTRHLRLLCPNLNRIKLELVAQRPVGTLAAAGGAEAMPADVERIEGDLVQREVRCAFAGRRGTTNKRTKQTRTTTSERRMTRTRLCRRCTRRAGGPRTRRVHGRMRRAHVE